MFLSLWLRWQAYTLFLSAGGGSVLNASFPKRIAEGPRGSVCSPSIRLGFQMFPGNGLSTCIILLLLLTAWRWEFQSTQHYALAYIQLITDGWNKPLGGHQPKYIYKELGFVMEFGKSLLLFFFNNSSTYGCPNVSQSELSHLVAMSVGVPSAVHVHVQ